MFCCLAGRTVSSKLIARYQLICWLLAVLLLVGCGSDPADPEEVLRDTFDRIEAAAEDRDLGELIGYVADDYEDAGGRTIKEVRAMAQLEFIRNPKIHLFKVVRDLKMLSDTRAEATILVAMAGRPIDAASALSGLRADLMRFDLKLIDRDGWKIESAEWQLAEAKDFL